MSTPGRHSTAILVTVSLGALIAYLTLTPPNPDLKPSLLSDKAYHVIAFAGLVFPSALLYRRSLIWLIPAALIFGAAIEVLQPLVGRSADFADFAADVAGIVIGVGAGLVLRAYQRAKRVQSTCT